MPSAVPTSTTWGSGFHTARQRDLFRNPPKGQTAFPLLEEAFRPHVDSFDSVLEKEGLLDQVLKEIGTYTIQDGDPTLGPTNKLRLRITQWSLDKPVLPPTNKFSTRNREIYPAECRERQATYRGKFRVQLAVQVNDGDWAKVDREVGFLPIMLRSSKCHLKDLSPFEMTLRKEETEEFGGYFIVNGNEKLVRMLLAAKRNFPLAIKRPAFKGRGRLFTEYGIQTRSLRPDQTAQTNTLHYLKDMSLMLRFTWRRSEYTVPLMMILNALLETNDREIFRAILDSTADGVVSSSQRLISQVAGLLRSYKEWGTRGRTNCRAFLGRKFKPALHIPADYSDDFAGGEVLRRMILPHLGSVDVTPDQDQDKFWMLICMTRKLYALVEGDCAVDNVDAVSNQEMLLPGSLYVMVLRERLEDWLLKIEVTCRQWCQAGTAGNRFTDFKFMQEFVPNVLRKTPSDVGRYLEYFLATGNVKSDTSLELQQTTGYTVVAEKLNFFRFLSHFRCVHRGAFFATLKTTTVRKLLPESWGFLCPVHTPDGSPCGLLNHLAHKCKVATSSSDVSALPGLIADFDVRKPRDRTAETDMMVQLNGRILGFCTQHEARVIADTLRFWKVEKSHNVPLDLEVGYVPAQKGGQYPGIFMSSSPARMYRPVKYLPLDKLDYVGPFEQAYMSIACTEPEVMSGDSTHVEYDPTNMLSIVANMTPFSDFNQSPRNMYQCQMGKQTMGTYGTAIGYRADNKAYRLQTGQTPVVRPPLHNAYGLDNFPSGTNAVVAVLAYTGYDMDDAMIISRFSHDRGFAHGSIYKTKVYEVEEESSRDRSKSSKTASMSFGFVPGSQVPTYLRDRIEEDGMPIVGAEVNEGDFIAAYHTVSYDHGRNILVNRDGQTHFLKYKEAEKAFVDEVRLLGSEDGTAFSHTMSVKYRIPRSPVIGDKFSSRHGQKGVCSQKWPAIDMPFSESGMIPDIIINPHAFPSRMTIGMFIESLAGKSGCLHGLAQDSTPFRFEDRKGATATEFFGEQLRAAGYNYHGNEPMYSGVTGEEFSADVFLGVVYYQRLRHMVNDKFQVRTTGPVNPTTLQPVKGRSRGGGIRVGEMERDSLIAHGAAFLLQDRLMHCSDYAKAWVCTQCGMFLGTTPSVAGFGRRRGTGVVRCRLCASRAEAWMEKGACWEDGDGIRWSGGEETTVVAVPGVLRYLDVELAAMGVKLKFRIEP
ncbi:MAG: hypothetical protein M1828_003230 [Chrysothrix sp. TS-e1954]|nr:MAG: hypothetical protein M1828_003230 [Chrysothrix sp. TS-e1954]